MIPAELLAKYGLREGDALDAVEVGIARALTHAIKKNIAVRINDRLEITAFSHKGEPIEISTGEIDRKLQRHILYLVELELQKRQTLRESEGLEELRGKTLSGEISRITDDGTLHVDLEIVDLFSCIVLSGECPERYQRITKRDAIGLGKYGSSSYRAFCRLLSMAGQPGPAFDSAGSQKSCPLFSYRSGPGFTALNAGAGLPVGSAAS